VLFAFSLAVLCGKICRSFTRNRDGHHLPRKLMLQLNPRQQQAVRAIDGPVLVLAGAGSGKTRVITEKIAYLITRCGYSARNIAAVTFTNKAAREMKERVGQTLGREHTRGLTVSTFHNLGLTIIRKEVTRLNMKPGFSLFDDQDSFALLKALTEDDWDDDKQLVKMLQSQISHWRKRSSLMKSCLPKFTSATARICVPVTRLILMI
jgi:superfamily I DNA/RNA helicase